MDAGDFILVVIVAVAIAILSIWGLSKTELGGKILSVKGSVPSSK